MIRYALACANGHAYEAWFGSSADYDDQAERGLVECPMCGVREVSKQIMAPAVAGTKAQAAAPSPEQQARMHSMMMEAAGEVRKHVEANFEHVGDQFAREARDIHDGAAPDRAIYGEATAREVRDLLEDGVRVAPLPPAAAPKPRLN